MKLLRRSCIWTSCFLVILILNGCVHQTPSKAPENKPPAPTDVRIIPPAKDIPKEQSSWSYHGKALPFVPDRVSFAKKFDLWKMPYEFRPIYEINLENASAVKKATIPVERIKGPILLISGKDDRIWPSTPMSEMVMKRLRQHRHPYPFQHLSYAGAGHNIGVPYGTTTVTSFRPHPTGTVWALGGNAKDNAFANADSWPKVLEFLSKSLK